MGRLPIRVLAPGLMYRTGIRRLSDRAMRGFALSRLPVDIVGLAELEDWVICTSGMIDDCRRANICFERRAGNGMFTDYFRLR